MTRFVLLLGIVCGLYSVPARAADDCMPASNSVDDLFTAVKCLWTANQNLSAANQKLTSQLTTGFQIQSVGHAPPDIHCLAIHTDTGDSPIVDRCNIDGTPQLNLWKLNLPN
jgi:hypothetical protein